MYLEIKTGTGTTKMKYAAIPNTGTLTVTLMSQRIDICVFLLTTFLFCEISFGQDTVRITINKTIFVAGGGFNDDKIFIKYVASLTN
jgi:hypothetical protein